MLAQDLRFALRQIRTQPGFAVLAIFVLALGIGGSTAVFCVLYQALLKPLPYPDAQRLLFVHSALPKSQVSLTGVCAFDYAEISKHSDVFSSSGIFFWNDMNLSGVGTTQHVDVVNASASLFATFSMKPQIGHVYADDQKAAILSESLWRGAFGSDPRILGRVIHLDGDPYTVVGVMPRRFQFPSWETQLWIPVGLKPSEFTIEGGRMEKWLHMVTRLAPTATPEQASAILASITGELSSRYPALYTQKDGWHFIARQLSDEQTEKVRRWLYLAFAAVFSVLLIASINVSGLLLIRGAARQSEMATRLALGATRFRIVRQMLTETAVLGFSGCLFGTVLALWGIHLVNLYGPMSQPTPLLTKALLFAPAFALLATLAAGVLPAWLGARGGATRTFTSRGHWRAPIIANQIALAVTLLFTAVQLNRSFLNLTHVPPGFRPQRVWTGAVGLSKHNEHFFQPLLETLAATPGVQLASGGPIPFNPSGLWTELLNLQLLHRPEQSSQSPPPEAQVGIAFPGYFEAMGIPLLRGRTFSNHDSSPTAIIDSELAKRYFPNEDPIGKLIASGHARPATIVGVVGSVHNSDLGGPQDPEIYYQARLEKSEGTYLVLRMNTDLDPTATVRKAIAKLDPDAALYDVKFMETRLAASLKLRRFIAFLLNGLAFTGLLLAVVGLYASLAHLVQLRQREIGIRVAVGATRPRIVRLILFHGAAIVLIGLIAGAFAAVAAGRAIQSQLFGAQLTDASAWVTVLGVILIAGAVSAYLPASRAARVDPSLALRHE